MTAHYPPEFKDLISSLLGSQADSFWEALQLPPGQGLRINPAKTTLAELRGAIPGEYLPLPWARDGYRITTDSHPGKHPFHGAGLFYLQEPSAMAPAAILDPQPGERILDLCAAPGGKTTQIQSLMGDQGILVANDPNPSRVGALARNLERWGARSCAVLSETPQRLSEHFGSFFDRVIVDAPCSGEGTFRSDPGQIRNWSPSFSARLRADQDEILWFAARLVRPGGLLVYSTCTFNQAENEGAIAHFLEARPDFELEAIPEQAGFSPGIDLPGQEGVGLAKAVRIWPHTSPGEGHFIARLRKSSSAASDPPSPLVPPPLDRAALPAYQEFFMENLVETESTQSIAPSSQRLGWYGNRLYWVPEGLPDLEGLRVIHWGWWLGTAQGSDFTPGPALAAALDRGDAQKVLEFSLADPRLDLYRRGSPLSLAGSQTAADGWTLVSAAGHPLGWGKMRGGRLKSYFPRWLRSN